MGTSCWLAISGQKDRHYRLGRIGRKVAELLKKLDVIVSGFDIKPDKAWAQTRGIALVTLEELLSQSDMVSLHLSSLAQEPFVWRP